VRILFFRIGAIGDVLLTTPAVRAVRNRYPDAEIHYMAGKSAARILRNNPDIDRVIVFNERFNGLIRLFRVIFMAPEIKKSLAPEYDMFIDFESSYYSAYISMAVTTRNKIGFLITQKRRKIFNGLYSTRVVYDVKNEYLVNRHLCLAYAAGAERPESLRPVLRLSNEELTLAGNYYKDVAADEKLPGVHFCISGTWRTKRWPIGYWIRLAELLSEKFSIFITWGPGDEKDVQQFVDKNISNTHIIPQVELRQLAAIISYGRILVSGDNGVRHIANALGLKTVGIFGPTNDKAWAYEDAENLVLVSDIDCRPCDKIRCGNSECMTDITPEIVKDKVVGLMNRE
jgi:ADP-heptose:LPS heptosyltransferase